MYAHKSLLNKCLICLTIATQACCNCVHYRDETQRNLWKSWSKWFNL